ncbi:MAG: hypothetical protein GX200_04560 [Firmicutes bacterium]|nr:hypothetical protein [Bacillota bacterium]
MENVVSGSFDPADVEKNKVMAALAYILFFLPLVACPDSRFGRYHANQGLILLIVAFIGCFILGMIPIIGWLLLPFYSIAIFVLFVIGLVTALNGKAKPLPIIGNIQLIK